MWRHGMAGLLVSALAVAPAAATTCAFLCDSASHPHVSGEASSAAHTHHTAAPPMGSDELGVRASTHDCQRHDSTLQTGATPPRSVELESLAFIGSEPTPRPRTELDLIVRSVRSTHGPPGYCSHVTSSVLRI